MSDFLAKFPAVQCLGLPCIYYIETSPTLPSPTHDTNWPTVHYKSSPQRVHFLIVAWVLALVTVLVHITPPIPQGHWLRITSTMVVTVAALAAGASVALAAGDFLQVTQLMIHFSIFQRLSLWQKKWKR